MRSEQEMARAHALLDSTRRAWPDEADVNCRLFVHVSLNVLDWVLERGGGEIFQSYIERFSEEEQP